MSRNLFLGILLAFIIMNQGCSNDECNAVTTETSIDGINGKWNWTKSIGGIGGWTETPESEGYTRYIVFDNFYYSEFQNDSKLFERQYDLEIRPDTFLGLNTYLVLESGVEYTFDLMKDTLVLTEVCFDCYQLKYVRN